VLRILTLRGGTRRSRHSDTHAREADVLPVAPAVRRRPERSRRARRVSETHHSAPWIVLVFLVFEGLVCVASREPAKGCPTHSEGGWLFGGCTVARGTRVPPRVGVPAPLSTARRRVGTTVSPFPSPPDNSSGVAVDVSGHGRARRRNHAPPRVRARRHHRDWGKYGAFVGVSGSAAWARSRWLWNAWRTR